MTLKLIAVGFWGNSEGSDYGGPVLLPRADYSNELKSKIIGYLKNGIRLRGYLGLDYCRFRCGIRPQEMGSCDYTDGKYVWPQGYYHYLEIHNVMLPQWFVDHIAKTNSVIRCAVDVDQLSREYSMIEMHQFLREYSQRP